MPDKTKHQLALELLNQDRVQEAGRLLTEALAEQESCDLWNDWATVKVACNEINEARSGFERALTLDAENAQAQFNLGLILVSHNELDKGFLLLRKSAVRLGKDEQEAVAGLLQQHGRTADAKVDSAPPSNAPDHKTSKRVLIIHEMLPHFDRGGSAMRIMQVIRQLRAQGHAVTYVARNSVNRDRYESALTELGVKIFSGDSERMPALCVDVESDWKFETVLQTGRFDVAILFHWFWSGISVTEHYLDDIRRHSLQTKVLVLTDDRHGIREWRLAELSDRCADRERALDFLVREVECYRAADMVLAITEDDRKGLVEMVPDLQTELLPMTAEIHESTTGFDARHGFIFLADFDNRANHDATLWFCNEVWPRVRKRLPDAKLYLAGNNLRIELVSGDGIEILGYVASIKDTLEKCRVFVSPIRYGTGIKTKNLHALGNGIPLITTTIGAEGMDLKDGENAVVADTAGEFANKAVELHSNRELWQKLATNGRSHIAAAFSVSRLNAQLAKIMDRASTLVPHAYDSEHRFSARVVEELHPEVLTRMPAVSRHESRILGYAEMAERLIGLGRPAEAIEQLRHIFCFVGGNARSLFLARIFSLLERCYRETGDQDAASRCGQEAKLCLPELNPAMVKKVVKNKSRGGRPSDRTISVVIPTFNRKDKLERCLKTLATQTLPAEDFEVVVVDDGSTDDTREFLKSQDVPFRLIQCSQKNQGVGAARRLGVENSSGEYLLLINDDTLADPNLLQEHLQLQREYHESCFAVLGTFEYERAARKRALTHFLSVDPFMFPQVTMYPGWNYGPTHFVTCNLSVRRDAVLACGSFDPSYRLGEDTELGLRMAASGCKVLYNPQARSWHDHLDITVMDLVRRAKAYGPIHLRLLRQYPAVRVPGPAGELAGPVTAVDIARIREVLDSKRKQIEETVAALRQYDDRDFEPFFATRSGKGTAADMIVNLFRQAIPEVHWFYIFDGLCSAWEEQAPPVVKEAPLAGVHL